MRHNPRQLCGDDDDCYDHDHDNDYDHNDCVECDEILELLQKC